MPRRRRSREDPSRAPWQVSARRLRVHPGSSIGRRGCVSCCARVRYSSLFVGLRQFVDHLSKLLTRRPPNVQLGSRQLRVSHQVPYLVGGQSLILRVGGIEGAETMGSEAWTVPVGDSRDPGILMNQLLSLPLGKVEHLRPSSQTGSVSILYQGVHDEAGHGNQPRLSTLTPDPESLFLTPDVLPVDPWKVDDADLLFFPEGMVLPVDPALVTDDVV